MRFLRVLAVATGFIALLSQSSAAQDERQFKDAWFWGAKAGATSYSSASTTTGGARSVGAEMLITPLAVVSISAWTRPSSRRRVVSGS